MNRHDSTASQDTFVSLRQLDPLPVESPFEEGQKELSPSRPRPHSRSSTLGLSGSNHSTVYYLTRLQKYSSYVFTVYTAFHITNTSIIPLITRSVPASESYLLLTRPYYQSVFLEPLLVTIPIATHILSGAILRIKRRNANLTRYGGSQLSLSARLEKQISVWPKMSWSSFSGYLLAPLVIGHAVINRTLPWIYDGGSSGVGLQFVSHGFAKHPFLAWTGYTALLGVGVAHFVWGIARWNNWVLHGSDRRAKRRWWSINGISAAVTLLWAAGGMGVVGRGGRSDGWIGKGYDVLYSKVPLLKL